jgi:PP-loop superfamily ATP-utilizing enzyme
MDTSDVEIVFYGDQCSNCIGPLQILDDLTKTRSKGMEPFERFNLDSRLPERKYDAVIGVSGGIDSSYALHMLANSGLRLVAIHIDCGWNSAIAASNIRRMCSALNVPLKTLILDWESIRKLQIAYLKSGLLSQDVVQDHLFSIHTKKFALSLDVSNIVSGWNFSSESILPQSWAYSPKDGKQIRAIGRKFGMTDLELNKLEVMSFFKQKYAFDFRSKLKTLMPLNLIDYNRDEAILELQSIYGWKEYGSKHEESRWTKFFQGVILPDRWGIDKRRAHLSSQIIAGQITRAQALAILSSPALDDVEKSIEKEFVASKLGISLEDIEAFLALPLKSHSDYPGSDFSMKLLVRAKHFMSRLLPPH